MESQSTIGKRKKRKTRKCLDELRKRSRTNCYAARFLESPAKHQVPKFSKNCVTLNRLTLNLLPKAIRSETITRPILAEIKRNPNLKLDDLVKGKNVRITCSSDDKILEISNIQAKNAKNESHASSPTENEIEVAYTLKTIDCNGRDQDVESSPSYLVFSPTNHLEGKLIDPIKVVSAPVTTITSPCSQDIYGYSLYKEFMSEISTYLKQTSSDHFKENVINENKALLHSVYVENHKRKYDNKILKYGNVSHKKKSYAPSETIMHNPVDYIRHSQFGYQYIETDQKREQSESLSDSTSTPFASQSLHESTNPSTSNVLYETPEYIYYPHKLNQ